MNEAPRVFLRAYCVLLVLFAQGCATGGPASVSALPFTSNVDCGLDEGSVERPSGLAPDRSIITPANANNVNDSVTISVDLATAPGQAQRVDIIGGPQCRPIWQSPVGAAQRITWAGTDSAGRAVRPGVYYARLSEDGKPRAVSVPISVVEDPCFDAGAEAPAMQLSVDAMSQDSDSFTVAAPTRACVRIASRETEGASRRLRLEIDGQIVVPDTTAIPAEAEMLTSITLEPGAHSLHTVSEGKTHVSVTLYPEPVGPPDGPPVPAIRCQGMLRGFEHPFGVHGRRPMMRQGIEVECVAHYKVDFGVRYPVPGMSGKPRRIIKNVYVRARGVTDAGGSFDILISEADFAAENVVQGFSEFQKIFTTCVGPDQCGHEARSVPREVISNIPPVRVQNLDVLDVLHLTRPTDEQITSDASRISRVGARLISNGTGPAMNDRPVIIHEQIDTADVEHTQFMVWALSGQPTLIPENVSTDICAQESADLDEQPRPCIGFSSRCNPSRCGEPGVRCRTANILRQLLDSGYDVWTVDHLSGQDDILRIAASSPALYDAIRFYGVQPNQLVSTGTSTAEPLPVTPPSRNLGARRIAVGGISLGAVVARIGLKLWEKRFQLDALNVQDISGARLTLPGVGQTPSALAAFNDPLDDVALYFSFDGPHLGARVPLALQAYVQDIPGEFSIEQRDEISSASTRGMLERWVDAQPGLGCFVLDGDGEVDGVDNCNVSSIDSEVVMAATPVAHDAVAQETIAKLDRQFDDPLNRPPDGLPDYVPSVAITNGAHPDQPRQVGTDEVFRVRIDIGDDITLRHKMFEKSIVGFSGRVLDDDQQPAGSQWDGICRAEGISVATYKPLGVGASLVVAALGCDNSVLDAVWCVPSLFGSLFDGGRKVTATPSTRMKPETDSTGSLLPGTGFPTLVRTESALLDVTANREFDPSETWRDFYMPARNQFHSDFTDDQCRFLMYHLDGFMSGDGDGFPSCESVERSLSCADGGRWPGNRLNDGDESAVCDCDDSRAYIYPGSGGVFDCNNRPEIPDLLLDF